VRGGLEPAARSLPSRRRTFTNSAAFQINGAVPTFTETSSPELDSLLSQFRSSVFLPAHLAEQHRKLISGTRYRKALEDDPVNVEIAGEQFRLKHVDRTTDLPDTRKGVREAVKLMKDKKDWDNLPPLLEGLHTAGRKKVFKKDSLQTLVRKAGMAGRQDIILECARRVSKTGFALKDRSVVEQVMWWIQWKAASENWSAKATKKALTLAEQVSILLEDERHSGGRLVLSNLDPRVSPGVIGVLLELAATQAKLQGGKDDDGKVRMYAERLINSMRHDTDWHDDSRGSPRGKHASSAILCKVTPILYGVRTAVEVLDPLSGTVAQLREVEKTLAAEASNQRQLLLQEFPEESEERPLLGLQCYDTLIGAQE